MEALKGEDITIGLGKGWPCPLGEGKCNSGMCQENISMARTDCGCLWMKGNCPKTCLEEKRGKFETHKTFNPKNIVEVNSTMAKEGKNKRGYSHYNLFSNIFKSVCKKPHHRGKKSANLFLQNMPNPSLPKGIYYLFRAVGTKTRQGSPVDIRPTS